MSLTKAKAEKSRVHAKQRRTEEAREIAEIAELLPLPSSVTKRLDKSSILRLAITFLRLKQYVGEDIDLMNAIQSAEMGEGSLMLESLSGFFIIISADEDIIFVSENVEKHMGVTQIEMLGKDVYEFVYDKDKVELKKQFVDKYQGSQVRGLGLNSTGNAVEMDIRCASMSDTQPPVFEQHRQFFLRMKCSYQRRGGGGASRGGQHSAFSTQNDYVLLQWTGYLHYNLEGNVTFLAAVARPLQPTPIMELKMDGNMFISRHALDMKFMYCDPRLSMLLGYEPDGLAGNTMYAKMHPGDLQMCGECHTNLMAAGTSISKYYRFLSKTSEWCWLQTRATIVYNTSKHPQYIVCMNYIVSEKEGRRYLLEHLNETDNLTSKVQAGSVTHVSPNAQQTMRSSQSSSQLQHHQQQHSNQHMSPPQYAEVPLQQQQHNPHTHVQQQSAHVHNPHTHVPQQQQSVHVHNPHTHVQQQSVQHSAVNNHNSMDMSSSLASDLHEIQLDETSSIYSHSIPSAGSAVTPAFQHPSPTSSYSDQQSPTFYLPDDSNSSKMSSPPQSQPVDDIALGNLWLSVHSVVDPSHQYQTEIIPPSLAEEMEDISFEHCNKLMNQATKSVVQRYSNVQLNGNDDERLIGDWTKCERLVDREPRLNGSNHNIRQAIDMFQRFANRSEDEQIKRSRSSSSLMCHTSTDLPYHARDQPSHGSLLSQPTHLSQSPSSSSTHSSGGPTPNPQHTMLHSESGGFLAGTNKVHDQTAGQTQPFMGQDSSAMVISQQSSNPEANIYPPSLGGNLLPNVQMPAFGELPQLDELFQNHPELYNRSMDDTQYALEQQGISNAQVSPPLTLPMAPPISTGTAPFTHQTLSSVPSFMSLISDTPYNRIQSAMSLSSNFSSENSMQRLDSLTADMHYDPSLLSHSNFVPPTTQH